MRKLTVKNFSVIKDAELEFGKITVLIGPQASGKSLLCKLAYFFQKVVPEIAQESIRKGHSLDTFRISVADQFVNGWFPLFGPEPLMEVTYEDGAGYRIAFSVGDAGNSVASLSQAIELNYRAVRSIIETKDLIYQATEIGVYGRELHDAIKSLQSQSGEVYSYIPATRSFFLTLQRAFLGTSERIDPFTRRFPDDFSYDFALRVPKAGLDSELSRWIDKESRRILMGEVVSHGNAQEFHALDGRILPLSFLSSGTQELLPLITCLREFVGLSAAVAETLDLKEALHRRLFFVEEPETSIFPTSQYDLVRIFARLSSEPLLDASWVITTHSPYIMTAFNTLLEAGRVGAKPGNHEKVNAVVPEQYWIRESDFKAYAIEDGNLISIFKPEAEDPEGEGMINGDYLDSVSDRLGKEFNRLLDIEFAE